MHGRTVLVTGANTGIGLETAASLAEKGARVVLTSRDPAKGKAAVEDIGRRHPDADVTAMELDLSRLADVRSFAAGFLERFPQLHVLVNNAGVWLDRRSTTADGFETTFQVNHLGPFLLTNLLLDRLKESAPARIVNVASAAHRAAQLLFVLRWITSSGCDRRALSRSSAAARGKRHLAPTRNGSPRGSGPRRR